jgi:hypothetical protein
MTIEQSGDSSRRRFLKASSTLGLAIVFSPGLVGEAFAARTTAQSATTAKTKFIGSNKGRKTK